MNGWIVTWGGTEEGIDREYIVAVFNHRCGVERVRELVEQLYMALKYSAEDKVTFAADPKANPYPATKDRSSRIICGHNPHLYARYVNNIRRSGDGYTWDERDTLPPK